MGSKLSPFAAGLAALATLGLALAAIGVIFHEKLVLIAHNPRLPYQVYQPPAPPNYDRGAAWLSRPAQPAKGADIFVVHGTTYFGRDGWNAAFDQGEPRDRASGEALANQAGPFADAGDIWAPAYRQATLFAFLTRGDDQHAALDLAYRDVRAAFQAFRAGRSPGRPLVLVGHDQGGAHILRLLADGSIGPAIRSRLAAAYVIDAPVHAALLDSGDLPPICSDETATGCLVTFGAFPPGHEKAARRFRNILKSWRPEIGWRSAGRNPPACVNPLSWNTNGERAAPERHLGAAAAGGLVPDLAPVIAPRLFGAQCVDGALRIDEPARLAFRRGRWFGRDLRPTPFNWFYADLKANIEMRLAAFNAQSG